MHTDSKHPEMFYFLKSNISYRARAQNKIGSLYKYNRQYDLAIQYYNKAIEVIKSCGKVNRILLNSYENKALIEMD